MNDFNKTYGDSFVKTTINIRKSMMVKVHERMDELSKEDLIDYLRDLISLDIRYKIIGSMEDISLTKFRSGTPWERGNTQAQDIEIIKNKTFLSVRSDKGVSRRGEYNSPPRRYSGFAAGLLRSSFILNWFSGKR